MPSTSQTRPRKVDFDDPPVVETVLGVRFAPLPGWDIPHFGLFWNGIRNDYPRFEVHPPIGTGAEIELRLSPQQREGQRAVIEFGSGLPIRCWFYDSSETTLIQVQNDCFIHNWRKVSGIETYAHYDGIRPLFEAAWARFREFVTAERIASPNIWQCEVTYVNHLDRGIGWDGFADLPQVIPSWVGRGSGGFLPAPEAVHISALYPLPEKAGSLQIVLQPAVRQKDGKEIIQLTLSARGKPPSSHDDDIMKWLDTGHDWVVQGFKDFTSRKMHDIWRVKV